jgi:integrase
MHPDTVTDIFKKFIKRHNLLDIRLHDLRHTSCTMLINAGLNVRAIASRMGHANANVTLTVYSHALKSADREAANILENLTARKNENPSQKQENIR